MGVRYTILSSKTILNQSSLADSYRFTSLVFSFKYFAVTPKMVSTCRPRTDAMRMPVESDSCTSKLHLLLIAS